MQQKRISPLQRGIAASQAIIVTAGVASQIHTGQMRPQQDIERSREAGCSRSVPSPPPISRLTAKMSRQISDWKKIRLEHQRREGMERGTQLKEPVSREERSRSNRIR